MNKEEFLKAIENVPKTDNINLTSAYNSINIEDLADAVDRFKKLPTYDELLKENQKYKEVFDKLKEWINIVQQNKDNKHLEPFISTDELDELLDILNEVSE